MLYMLLTGQYLNLQNSTINLQSIILNIKNIIIYIYSMMNTAKNLKDLIFKKLTENFTFTNFKSTHSSFIHICPTTTCFYHFYFSSYLFIVLPMVYHK